MAFAPGSSNRLTRHDLDRFAGTTLFDRIARVICEVECLPRKELFEAWEVGRRTRRLFRGGRVVDFCAGHGLLAAVMLLLDDSSAQAMVVDTSTPQSATAIHEALIRTWPRLDGRISRVEADIEAVPLSPGDVVVSSHACGVLTDRIIGRATASGARLAVLPCCHDLETCVRGPLAGWLDGPLAVDVMRAVGLEQRGYRVWTQQIPVAITPKNRLILASPTP